MKQRDLLKKYSIRPSKLLGQNFLLDENVIRNIVDVLDPIKGEIIVEIGPGLGALTSVILGRGAYVVGVERDRNLIAILEKELGVYKDNFKVIEDDILKFDFNKYFASRKVRIVGNLPYYLTSPLIFRLFEQCANITSAILMVQKEVADRILATPGTPEYGRLTVAVRFFAEAERIMNVSKKSFMPSPKVDSTVIRLNFRLPNEIKKTGVIPKFFLEIVKAAFSQRRKNILNCLFHAQICNLEKPELNDLLEKSAIKSSQRAETLFLKDFLLLCRKLQDIRTS